jgi:hypothetical protein
MTLDQWSSLAQILGSIGVVVSLVFVGLQVRQNTSAIARNEHNNTMAQWTVVRMAVAQSRDMAELMTAGLAGTRELDDADHLRMAQMLAEYAWASFHIWDRTQRGVFPPGTFEATAGPLLAEVLTTPRGGDWWREAKHVGYFPGYVAAVDAVLAAHRDALPLATTASGLPAAP